MFLRQQTELPGKIRHFHTSEYKSAFQYNKNNTFICILIHLLNSVMEKCYGITLFAVVS